MAAAKIGPVKAHLTREELAKIAYLDPDAIYGRALLMMPFWDGSTWRGWVEAPPGKILEMQIVDTIHSNYVAKDRAREADLWIQFVDCMWQQANWPDVGRAILAISDDFHLLATSAAKLRHFFHARATIESSLISSFVKTEIEYILTVARSVFDLLQEVISVLWNTKIILNDPASEAVRKRCKLPNSFTKMVLQDRSTLRSAEDLTARHALPPILSAEYVRFAPFYASLLAARDRIIHRGLSVDIIFVTEKGFCVDRGGRPFSDFGWKPEHQYNDTLVSLLPWLANIVFGTIEACNDIIGTFASVFSMPPEIAPGYRIFIRDPASDAIIHLGKVANGQIIWWSDEIQAGPQTAGSPPTIVDRP